MMNMKLRYTFPSSVLFFAVLIYGYYEAWS